MSALVFFMLFSKLRGRNNLTDFHLCHNCDSKTAENQIHRAFQIKNHQFKIPSLTVFGFFVQCLERGLNPKQRVSYHLLPVSGKRIATAGGR
jgi:hypothetical protein